MALVLDTQHCYPILKARDSRFDGMFFVGVSSTGIYCRPVCTVRTPGRDRCTFYANAAAAEVAGYRPCLRCRPELAPGMSTVDVVKRNAHAAVQSIQAGALNEGSVEDLAVKLKMSARQLRRVVESEYGATPTALAQTQRLLLAKQLLTDSQLRVVDVAFASGFASVRQFNRVFRQSYQLSPASLRQKSARQSTSQDDTRIVLKLGYRPPLAWNELVEFLTSRSSARVEQLIDGAYVRTVLLSANNKMVRGWIAARADSARSVLQVQVSSSLLPVLPELQLTLRRLFDLNANPHAVDQHLKSHALLENCVRKIPGLRIPGAMDGFALALRAVLGQQISVKAATTIYGRFIEQFGEVIETPFEGLDRSTPRCEAVASASLQQLIELGLTGKRAQTVAALASAMASGAIKIDYSADRTLTCKQLQALPGIGAWTAQYIAMRALSDPDAFPDSDLGLLRAAKFNKPAQLVELAEAWRPWRAYAAMHLWHDLSMASTTRKGG